MDGGGERERREFLPPEPSGSEPELSDAETRELGSAEAGPQSPSHGGYAPPSGAQPGWGSPPPPPPGAPQGHSQAQPQQWGPAHGSTAPDNGSAVAGFTLSLVGGGLLLITLGLSSIVSIVCSALGIFYSKRGRDRVDRGETPKHRGLAQAGFIIGLIALVLSVLATLAYGALAALYLSNDDFQRDFERELERELDSQRSVLPFGVAALARGALALIS